MCYHSLYIHVGTSAFLLFQNKNLYFLHISQLFRQLKNQVKNLKSLTEQLQEEEKDKFATEQEITKLKRQVSYLSHI